MTSAPKPADERLKSRVVQTREARRSSFVAVATTSPMLAGREITL
jgi:hypothetical protein